MVPIKIEAEQVHGESAKLDEDVRSLRKLP